MSHEVFFLPFLPSYCMLETQKDVVSGFNECFSALVCCGIPPVYPTEIIRPHGLEPRIWVQCLQINIHLQVFPSSSWGSFTPFSRLLLLNESLQSPKIKPKAHLSSHFGGSLLAVPSLTPTPSSNEASQHPEKNHRAWSDMEKNLEKGLLLKTQHCYAMKNHVFKVWRVILPQLLRISFTLHILLIGFCIWSINVWKNIITISSHKKPHNWAHKSGSSPGHEKGGFLGSRTQRRVDRFGPHIPWICLFH